MCDDSTSSRMMMRAAVYDAFGGKISVRSVPYPKLPSDGGVIIQVMATGVCRSDWHGWKGHDSDVKDHGLPFVPGHELAGIVVQKATNVVSISLGDAVAVPFILSCGHCHECRERNRPTVCEQQEQPGFTMWGSFAEYVALPRADRNLRKIPKGVTFVEAAALGCRLTTAYRAVIQQGQWNNNNNIRTTNSSIRSIAIFGCGGLGLSCIMMATCFTSTNHIIIAIDVSQDALEKAKQLGATHVINAKNDDFVRKQVWKLTQGRGADLTLDAAGFKATCENAVWCTRRGGRMIQVGLPISGANNNNNPIIPMGLVAGREIEIVGSHGFDAKDMPDLLQLVASKRLNVQNLIEQQVTLEEGAQTLMKMDQTSPLGMTMITKFQGPCRL